MSKRKKNNKPTFNLAPYIQDQPYYLNPDACEYMWREAIIESVSELYEVIPFTKTDMVVIQALIDGLVRCKEFQDYNRLYRVFTLYATYRTTAETLKRQPDYVRGQLISLNNYLRRFKDYLLWDDEKGWKIFADERFDNGYPMRVHITLNTRDKAKALRYQQQYRSKNGLPCAFLSHEDEDLLSVARWVALDKNKAYSVSFVTR